jgi:hypothetical protein
MANIYTTIDNAIARSQRVFYIVENGTRPGYYLFDIDDCEDTTCVMWTQSTKVCWAYCTKQIARDFIEDCVQSYRILKVIKKE